MKPITIIESPYAAKNADGSLDHIGIKINVEYARACMRDALLRGEAPYASHLLYTQPGVLRDEVPEDRELGITSGFEFRRVADVIAVYTDLGISPGMQRAIDLENDRHLAEGRQRLEIRSLPEWGFVAARSRASGRWVGRDNKGWVHDPADALIHVRAYWERRQVCYGSGYEFVPVDCLAGLP